MGTTLPKISPLKLWFFTKYTRYLLSRRFHKVLVNNTYKPKAGATTLFFGNHCYWWDALIPLVLNDVFFKQDLRAIMERKQTEDWPFFLQIGAVPVKFGSVQDGRNLIKQCHEVLSMSNSSLWVFPEGKFYSIKDSPGPYQPLIGSLALAFPNTELACVSQYIDYQLSDKPTLYIDIKEVQIPEGTTRKELMLSLRKTNRDKLTEIIANNELTAKFINLY
jgi:hypothetical protein